MGLGKGEGEGEGQDVLRDHPNAHTPFVSYLLIKEAIVLPKLSDYT